MPIAGWAPVVVAILWRKNKSNQMDDYIEYTVHEKKGIEIKIMGERLDSMIKAIYTTSIYIYIIPQHLIFIVHYSMYTHTVSSTSQFNRTLYWRGNVKRVSQLSLIVRDKNAKSHRTVTFDSRRDQLSSTIALCAVYITIHSSRPNEQ